MLKIKELVTDSDAITDVVIPAATHLMHLEHGREGLFAATADWLSRRAGRSK